MKETVKVNLGQRLFDLDVDAYETLKKYLDSLKKHFRRSQDEAEEILQDIEQRISDLLEEKLNNSKIVVTIDDIDEIITKMGTAEDFGHEADEDEESTTTINEDKDVFSRSYDKKVRRLYRDIDHNIFGGVCSGIAAYFNIDTIWIRLLLVLLLLLKGIGLLAYLIMWIIVPAARTTAQKLEMSGIPVTVENIKQAVKSEFRKVKDNMHRYQKSESYRNMQSGFEEVIHVLGRIVLVGLKIFAIFLGVALVFAGIALVLGLITISSFHIYDLYIPEIPFFHYFHAFTANSFLFTLALLFVILIPVAAILVGLIKLLFNLKTHHQLLSAFAWVIWILSLLFIIFTMGSRLHSFSQVNKTIESNKLEVNHNKILHVTFTDDFKSKNNVELFNFFGKELAHEKGAKKFYLQPSLRISRSADSVLYLQIERIQSLPLTNTDYDLGNYVYKWNLNDSILNLNTNFIVDEDKIWNIPRIQLTVLVPEGKKIVIDKKGKMSFTFDPKISGSISGDHCNKVLILKNGELQEIDNKPVP